MIHFRKIIFELLDQEKSNEDIKDFIQRIHGMEVPFTRINNYRSLHTQLSSDERAKFLEGKLDLLGKLL